MMEVDTWCMRMPLPLQTRRKGWKRRRATLITFQSCPIQRKQLALLLQDFWQMGWLLLLLLLQASTVGRRQNASGTSLPRQRNRRLPPPPTLQQLQLQLGGRRAVAVVEDVL